MSFIFPVLLGGLAFISIPVLIHLIMRQKPITLPFPAFRFLLQKQRINRHKLRLRHLLLLLLRIFLVALICLALARPRLLHEGLQLSSDRPVAAVLIFDTSPSMAYRSSDDVTRLDEAKRRGVELLDRLPQGSRVAIIDTSEQVLSTRAEWILSDTQARERIGNLKVQSLSVPVSQRLEVALGYLDELSRNREEENAWKLPRVVFLFTDRAGRAWDAARVSMLRELGARVAPTLSGLQRANGDVTPLLEMLAELRTKLPTTSGQDYPDQSLMDALGELKPYLATITPADFPPDEKLGKLLDAVRRRTWQLTDMLDAQEKTVPEPAREYHDKLLAGLQRLQTNLRGWHGFLVDVGIAEPQDLAILELALPTHADGKKRQVFAADESFLLRAVVRATGSDFTNLLRLSVGDKTYQQPVNISAGEVQTMPFEVDLAELGLSAGQHSVELHLQAKDRLNFNNSRFVTFAIREPQRVLVLTDETGPAEDFAYALRVMGFAPRMLSPQKFLEDPQLFENQAVFLFGLTDPPAGLWSLLESYVAKGGGLGVFPARDNMNLNAYNEGPATKLLPAKYLKVIEQDKEPVGWDLKQESIFQHPFMRPFRAWRNNKNIDFIQYPRVASKYWEVQAYKDNAIELVRYADKSGSPAVLERTFARPAGKEKPVDEKPGEDPATAKRPVTTGRVLMFTTPFDNRRPAWNNYLESLTSFYVVLAKLTTDYLAKSEDDALEMNFITGESDPVVTLPLSPRFPVYLLRGSDVFEQFPLPEGSNRVFCKQATSPGNYTVEGMSADKGGPKYTARFSVNLPSAESDLTPVPAAAIERVLGPNTLLTPEREASLNEMLQQQWNEPVELLPWLLMALLLLLALENLLANKFYRRDPAVPREGQA